MPMVPLLSEDDQDVRMAVAAGLGKIGSKTATPALLNATKDVRAVREVAISSLCAICDPRSTSLLSSALSGSTDDGEVRARTARALSVIGGPQAIAALTGALDDLDLKVRSSAITGLQRVGGPAVGAIMSTVASGSQVARESAAEALEGITSPEAAAGLSKLAKDSDPLVRVCAARGLGFQGASARPEVLTSLLSDSDGTVGDAAVESLTSIRRPAIPSLISVLKSQATDVAKYRAADALAKIGSDAVPSLMSLAGSDASTSRWAAYALGQSRVPSAKPVLERLAKAGNKDLAYIAQRALNRM
jgi:HEAT repeat protein